jgi:glycosyltransferase involved in cell wall biosynthesis
MRIAYICFWNAYVHDGVAKKIETQAAHWRKAGHAVEVFCLTPRPEEPGPPALAASTFAFSHLPGRLEATWRLAAAVRRFRPDVIYLRNDLFLPPLWPVLRKYPLVMEMNGSPQEYVLRRARARAYYRWSGDHLLSYVDGFVCVARELADRDVLVALNRPRIVIGNGIELDAFPVLPEPGNARPRGVFLGGPRLPWHGVDKIVDLAGHLPEMDFDVVGPSADELGSSLPPNITVHGFLGRDEYESVLARADFAIGTLALHRTNLDEATPLKLREYLAFGLPVVLAHEDPDLTTEPAWFVLQLPNTESNVRDGYEDVRTWVGTIVGRRVPRDVAEALVGAEKKEAKRLAFMKSVADGFVRR